MYDVLDQEHRQNKRWFLTEAKFSGSVKGSEDVPAQSLLAHVAFPILAIAPSPRHAGIVCLNGRLQAFVARTLRLRDLETAVLRRRALRLTLERELAMRSPGIVVVESGFDRRSSPLSHALAEDVATTARASGFRIVRVSFAESCARLVPDGTARDVAISLLHRYDALARRLAPLGTPQLRQERWRETKPLLTAFALAHAAGVEILTSAARSPGTSPPPKSL